MKRSSARGIVLVSLTPIVDLVPDTRSFIDENDLCEDVLDETDIVFETLSVRDALIVTKMHGLGVSQQSAAEIAAIMGSPVTYVETIHKNALAKLRPKLEAFYTH